MTDWISVLLGKIETPALIIACLALIIFYRLLVMSNRQVEKLADEMHEMAKIMAGNSAIINICCVHGRLERNREGTNA